MCNIFIEFLLVCNVSAKTALIQKIIINMQETISFKNNKIKLYYTKFKCNTDGNILNYLKNMSIDLKIKDTFMTYIFNYSCICIIVI